MISQLANIGFRIQRTKLPLIKVSNSFLHTMPVLVNFSDFFLTTLQMTRTDAVQLSDISNGQKQPDNFIIY